MKKVLSLSAILPILLGLHFPVSATPVESSSNPATPTSGSALIVTPTQNSETNSTVNTSGSTLFNATQSVFNISGNKAEFGEQGCAFPTTLLNVAGNYGSTSADVTSLSGFNISAGATIPVNGQIAPLCVEASRIRVALLETRSTAEKRKLEADSLLFCYNLRKLALESKSTVIILPDYCPVELVHLPTQPSQTTVTNNPPVNQPSRELPPPPPEPNTGKRGG